MAARPEYASFPDVWSILGSGRYLCGDLAEAGTALRTSLELDPEDGWTNYVLARVYLEELLAELGCRHANHSGHEDETRTVTLVPHGGDWPARLAELDLVPAGLTPDPG